MSTIVVMKSDRSRLRVADTALRTARSQLIRKRGACCNAYEVWFSIDVQLDGTPEVGRVSEETVARSLRYLAGVGALRKIGAWYYLPELRPPTITPRIPHPDPNGLLGPRPTRRTSQRARLWRRPVGYFEEAER